MLSKLKKLLLNIFIFLVFSAPVIVILNGGYIWYRNYHRAHLQTLEYPEGKLKFILLMDLAGFEDPSWYVYQLPIDSAIPEDYYKAHSTDNVLFWNYSEAGEHYEDPKIEIVKNKFLLFSRGSYFHSLFEIKSGQVLVNVNSPYGSYMTKYVFQNDNSKRPSDRKIMMKELDDWVKENLHNKIKKIIDETT